MSKFTRRHFLGSMGALSAAGSVPGVLAATPGASGAMTEEITGIEKEATGFANPLRLPGSRCRSQPSHDRRISDPVWNPVPAARLAHRQGQEGHQVGQQQQALPSSHRALDLALFCRASARGHQTTMTATAMAAITEELQALTP